MILALTGLALGILLGLILGVPLGRRVERVAWHADATIARARLTGWLIRDLTGGILTAALIITVAAFAVWTLLRHHD
ncbi:hypothetical protein [Micromonospora schwarzwaldensis]|uniref:hypothetical protein n=1 Tax=Micromonospora sp. DSM 45708 TaxID=3111767 RepID=UPI0031E36609